MSDSADHGQLLARLAAAALELPAEDLPGLERALASHDATMDRLRAVDPGPLPPASNGDAP